MLRVYGLSDEAYIGNGGGVKDRARVGALQYSILKLLAESGLRQFTLLELWKTLKVDRRRVYQAISYLVRRGFIARVARGLYRLLVDPWELLERAVVQGPNAGGVKDRGGVKDGDGTRSVVRVVGVSMSGVGLFFDNVRGYTLSGCYVPGDRGRVLGRGELGGFVRVSYGELTVATGTGLFDGLGSVTVYFDCKVVGSRTVCSDWVEWRPPRGFYKQYSVVEAASVYRSRVLPYAFGLVGRAASVVRAPLERFRSSLYGLARRLYVALRPVGGGLG